MKVENRCLLLTLTRFHEDLLQVVFKLIKIVYMCDVVRVSRSDHKQFIVTDAVPNSHSNCADSLVLKQKKKCIRRYSPIDPSQFLNWEGSFLRV